MLTNRNYVVKENSKSPKFQKIGQIRQKLYDPHEKLYKRYGRTAKPAEEATNARLASVSIVEWVIFLCTKWKEHRLGKIWQLCKPKLRVNRLRVIRIRNVCELMRFDPGPEVFVCVNRNYVLTEYILNENDCTTKLPWSVHVHQIDQMHQPSRSSRAYHCSPTVSCGDPWAELDSLGPILSKITQNCFILSSVFFFFCPGSLWAERVLQARRGWCTIQHMAHAPHTHIKPNNKSFHLHDSIAQ